MSELTVPTTVSNFKERWVIVCVNPSNSDDKMEFASVVELNAELFRLKAEVGRLTKDVSYYEMRHKELVADKRRLADQLEDESEDRS